MFYFLYEKGPMPNDELAWFSQTVGQIFDKDKRASRDFVRSPEGREYLAKLVAAGHPFALLLLSEAVKLGEEPVSIIKGAISADYYRYTGKKPFDVKDDAGNVVLTLQPNELHISLHAAHNAEEYQNLSPLERLRMFSASLQELLGHLQTLEGRDPTQSLTPDSVILGISHLVRLFKNMQKDKQIIWETGTADAPLPEPMMKMAVRSSKKLSDAFGGTREVEPQDIKILCARASDLG